METRVKVPLAANRRRALLFVLTLVLPALILLLRPLGFTLQQSVILAALVLTILWWVTGVVERTAASLFLLAAFLLCSGAPIQTVFSFPLSENFVLITVSFLFSQGISNSGLPGKLLQPLLAHFARSPGRMVLSLLLSAAAMMFLIPQPFSRIIILSLIYREYFARINLSEPLRTALLFGLYYFSILINMSMIRGDIILNGALSSMAGLTVNEGVWAAYMLAPTLAYLLAAVLLYRFLFRRVLRTFPSSPAQTAERGSAHWVGTAQPGLSAGRGGALGHRGFSPPYRHSGCGSRHGAHVPPGAAAPAGRKGHQRQAADFPHSAFAIGGTLKSCGVADRLFSLFVPVFPQTFSPAYAAVVLLTVVLLHTVLGSNITTMSVVVPGLMSIGAGVAPPLPLMFLICIAVCSQFLLPFHHVILLLGEGDRCYSTHELLRVGIPHTALMLFAVFLLYLPWWRLLGAL